MKGMILTVTLVMLLAGCTTTTTPELTKLARQHNEHVYAVWTLPEQPLAFVTRNCPELDGGERSGWEIDLDVPNRSECVRVAGTRDPADVMFWAFELYRIRRHAIYGVVPLSPWYKSIDTRMIGVVGTQEQCETVRLKMDRKPPGVAGDESMHMAATACEGPRYFRRPAAAG